MLWIRVRVGETVTIGTSILTLLAKNKYEVAIDVDGKQYTVARASKLAFPHFVFHTGNFSGGLRLGFDAPESIRIRREKLETQLPAE